MESNCARTKQLRWIMTAAKVFEWLPEIIEQEKSPRQQECGRNGRLYEEIG